MGKLWNGIKGIGKAGIGLSKGIGYTAMGLGAAVGYGPVKAAMSGPAKFAAALGVGAIGGAIIADATGEDPGKGAKAMGLTALGVASVGALASTATFGKIGATAGSELINTVGSAAAGAVTGGLGVASQLGKKMVKMPEGKVGLSNLHEIKLSKFGTAVMGIGLLASGLGGAYKTFEQSRMGVNDGMMRTATPIIPLQQENSNSSSYANNAGATGDLVFSMYNNR